MPPDTGQGRIRNAQQSRQKWLANKQAQFHAYSPVQSLRYLMKVMEDHGPIPQRKLLVLSKMPAEKINEALQHGHQNGIISLSQQASQEGGRGKKTNTWSISPGWSSAALGSDEADREMDAKDVAEGLSRWGPSNTTRVSNNFKTGSQGWNAARTNQALRRAVELGMISHQSIQTSQGQNGSIWHPHPDYGSDSFWNQVEARRNELNQTEERQNTRTQASALSVSKQKKRFASMSPEDAFGRVKQILDKHGELPHTDLRRKSNMPDDVLQAAISHGVNTGQIMGRDHIAPHQKNPVRVWSLPATPETPDPQPAQASRYAEEDQQWTDPVQQERQSFEDAIDQNPLNATTHGVYADWLDDHGEHDEAGFRRAMGEWIGSKKNESLEPEGPSFHVHPSYGNGDTHSIYLRSLPEWARGMNGVSENQHREHIVDPTIPYAPNGFWFHWAGYRPMEEALRRSFRNTTQRQNPTQAARYADDETTPATPLVQPASNVQRHVDNIHEAAAKPNFRHYLESYLGSLSDPEYQHTVRALGASPSHDEDPHGGIFRRLLQHTPQIVQPAQTAQGHPLSPHKQELAQLDAVHEGPIGGKPIHQVKLLTLSNGRKGVFKPSSGEDPHLRRAVPPGTYYRRSSAASSVADILGMHDLVPPTTIKNHNGEIGSIQQFVEGETALRHRGSEYDGPTDAARSALFDYIVGNSDRHRGNWMLTPQGKLQLIDHDLLFPTHHAHDNMTNVNILQNAADEYLPIPDLRGLQGKWPEIEAELKHHGIEREAIQHTRNRYLAATSGQHTFFRQLPRPETLG